MYNPIHKLNKWSSKALKCVFLGYSTTQKGYKLYHPITQKHIVSKDVIFDEKTFYYRNERHNTLRDLDYLKQLDEKPTKETESEVDQSDQHQIQQPDLILCDSNQQLPTSEELEPDPIGNPNPNFSPEQEIPLNNYESSPSSTPVPPEGSTVLTEDTSASESRRNLEVDHYTGDWSIALRKGKRSCVKPRPYDIAHYLTFNKVSPQYKTFLLQIQDSFIPRTPQEAMQIPKWKEAMDEEMRALLFNDTWEIVDLPKGKRAVACRWVFTLKCTQEVNNKPKARLVAKGFTQI